MVVDEKFMRDLAYGSAVGDALGVPYEFMKQGEFRCVGMVGYGTHRKPAGTWSDDTSMTLATCDSLNHSEAIDTDDMFRRFYRWMRFGDYAIDRDVFDIGNTTYKALTRGVGMNGMWDSGNGSLMRISPLASVDAISDEDVRRVSAITHATKLCKDLCAEFVRLLREVHDNPKKGRQMASQRVSGINESNVRSGGYVKETFEGALWCYATTESYADCVLKAVNLGHDTDTIACVAGALAAAEYGYDCIPAKWIDALRGKDIIELCIS